MDLTKLVESRKFIVVIAVIAVLIIALVSFGIGIFVGYHKARFSYQWSENYDQNFGGPKHGIIGMFGGNNFMDAHGISGSIMKIDGSTIVIKGRNNDERTVLINDKTVIRRGNENLKVSDLRVNDNVVIIGNPDNSGQIQVELMRILPTPFPSGSNIPPPFIPPPLPMR